jgi:hypothetical protein
MTKTDFHCVGPPHHPHKCMNHEDYDIGSQLAAVSRYPIEPHRVYSNLSMDQSLPSAPRPTSVRHLALPCFRPGRPGWIISSGTGAAAQRKRILDRLDAFADDHSVFVPPHAIVPGGRQCTWSSATRPQLIVSDEQRSLLSLLLWSSAGRCASKWRPLFLSWASDATRVIAVLIAFIRPSVGHLRLSSRVLYFTFFLPAPFTYVLFTQR